MSTGWTDLGSVNGGFNRYSLLLDIRGLLIHSALVTAHLLSISTEVGSTEVAAAHPVPALHALTAKPHGGAEMEVSRPDECSACLTAQLRKHFLISKAYDTLVIIPCMLKIN